VVLLERPDLAGTATLHAAIERQLPGIVAATDSGDWYLFYDPDGTTDPGQRFPFCTLMTATATTPPPAGSRRRDLPGEPRGKPAKL
jgi:hypothetical protein